jgi:phage shock protein E
MKNLNYVVALFISFTLFACQANDSTSQETNAVSSTQQQSIAVSLGDDEWLESMKEKPGIVIDVRTSNEYADGYIDGANLVDVSAPGFNETINKLAPNKSEPVYLYCRSGARSKRAMDMLKNEGYTQIYELNSGILGWEKTGHPIQK